MVRRLEWRQPDMAQLRSRDCSQASGRKPMDPPRVSIPDTLLDLVSRHGPSQSAAGVNHRHRAPRHATPSARQSDGALVAEDGLTWRLSCRRLTGPRIEKIARTFPAAFRSVWTRLAGKDRHQLLSYWRAPREA